MKDHHILANADDIVREEEEKQKDIAESKWARVCVCAPAVVVITIALGNQ